MKSTFQLRHLDDIRHEMKLRSRRYQNNHRPKDLSWFTPWDGKTNGSNKYQRMILDYLSPWNQQDTNHR